MICPYCNKEMEAGYLQTGSRIAWTKEIHKFSILPRKGEIMLENNVFKGVNFQAYICKHCKKILFDYSDKAYEEGQ